ncbi:MULTISPECIES: hypothetical protein [Streptomyces]|uniref:Uncharacterized protein n=1 Tax=Streptomyces eurythermus TaxID=42237 RepID=A0ABW6Z7N0_9ACTN|nr:MULTISPECIES: hypothetical protein [Streptomyces]QIS68794.1 hypothetical protein HB370_01185 [Streptomyces sp. DSM 40868]
MDPISVALLAALAGGAGGELGRRLWSGLTTLVRRPLVGGQGESAQAPAVSSGEAELARLQEKPGDAVRAQALSTALAVRAVVDAEFSVGLRQWHEQAKLVRTGDGDVHNTISGGTVYGPVLQGRDFSGLSVTTSAPPPPASEGEARSTQG